MKASKYKYLFALQETIRILSLLIPIVYAIIYSEMNCQKIFLFA